MPNDVPLPSTIVLGDSLDVLRTWPSGCVDAIVCDPPYALGTRQPTAAQLAAFVNGAALDVGGDFAGYDWSLPSVELWRECLRVLRPGGHLLAFGGSRTFDLVSLGLRAAGFEIRDCIMWLYGQGMPKAKGQLKPMHEPIMIARKPTKTAGTGKLNTEACRLPSSTPIASHHGSARKSNAATPLLVGGSSAYQPGDAGKHVQTLGRWPSNLTLDEDAAALLDAQSAPRMHSAGKARSGSAKPRRKAGQSLFDGLVTDTALMRRLGDDGGASRFAYVAKASKRERTLDGRLANDGPCVKPLGLMRWLVRLACPPGGLVLDPWCGSGSTLHAAALEGMQWLGVEIDPHFHSIATERMRIVVEDENARTRKAHAND